ncbi:MAG: FAD-dependent oxidoreductase [Saprospiraceae bacterium]|nr:FAD-dependent oxidoreductase [Saprospiraceae bacterium]
MNELAYDIAIIGGGPAGTTCALALKNSGLKVVILEKATFPRDKVCGDAIPGLAVKTLRQISPQYAEKLAALPEKHLTKRTRFWLNDKRKVELTWVNPAYTCKRIDFDQQLFEWTKAERSIEVYENCNVQHLAYEADGVTVKCANQLVFHVKW